MTAIVGTNDEAGTRQRRLQTPGYSQRKKEMFPKLLHRQAVARLILVSICAALLTFPVLVQAQFSRNSVTGMVTDQSGAVIVGATVTAREVNTGVSAETTTNDRGYYLMQLPIGSYDISVSNPGFETAAREKVQVDVGADVHLDFKLGLATAQQTVEVVAQGAPLLRPESATVQTVVDNSLVNDLPIAVSGRERNAAGFLALTPGYNGSRLNGGAGTAFTQFVDGAVANASSFSPELTTNMIIPAFAVEQFQVVDDTLDPQDGRTSGGTIKYALKSGTNAYHGSAFDFVRNKDLDARSFFATTVAQDTQNEFGVELGGPVVIPHLYNGHNRTFFYVYYDGYRYTNTNTGTIQSLLTPAMKTGNFSAAGIPSIYDPNSTVANGSGGFTRTPFPGNIIPASELSPISTYIANLFPAPNLSGLSSNYIGNTLSTTSDNSGLIKIDQGLHNGHVSLSYAQYEQGTTSVGPTGPVLSGNVGDNHGYRAILNWDTIISPTLLNHFNPSFNRWHLESFSGGQKTLTTGSNLNQEAGLAQGLIAGYGLAGITAGGYYLGVVSDIDNIVHQNWRLADDLTWRHGSHSVVFGASTDRISTQGIQTSGGHYYVGTYTFAPGETALPGVSSSGFAAASFMLGDVDSGTWGQQPWQAFLFRPWALYAQDSWKILPNLTLNLGLRWEYERPIHEKDDRMANFDPNLPNPGAGGLLGALEFAGHGQGQAGVDQFANYWHKGFGPRLGLAYNLRKSTVLRMGYTINYDSNSGPAIFLNQQGYFSQATVASTNSGVTPAFNWAIGFPNVPLGPYFTPTFANGSSTEWMPPNGARLPMVENWNVGVQQLLPGGIMIDASYVGLASHHILNGDLNLNQINPTYFSLGSVLNAQVGSTAAVAAGITAPYPGFTGTVAQALRPYPQYQTITISADPMGNNTYNALQVRGQKRFSKGLTLLLSYTFSKNLTDTDGTYGTSLGGAQNFYNVALEKAVTSSDRPQVFVASYSYELPVGEGKPFRSGSRLLDRYVLGGWQISGIWTVENGTPLPITTEETLPAAGSVRANVVGSQVYSVNSRSSFNPATDLYINKAAFAVPAAFTFGDGPRLYSQLRSFGTINWNAVAEKKIPIKETLHFLLRAEFFNVLNTVNFSAPTTDLQNLSFGKITSAAAGRNGQVSLTLSW
jgi:Carboxypeptidase regulatory-like domain